MIIIIWFSSFIWENILSKILFFSTDKFAPNWTTPIGVKWASLGGVALPLPEKSDIEEAEGYGGFPISGNGLNARILQ